jgi:hypothetical protein
LLNCHIAFFSAVVTTSVVSLEALESALDTLLAVSSENQFDAIQVFNAFETPKLHYTSHTSSYELKSDAHRRIHAGPEHRINLLRDRYVVVGHARCTHFAMYSQAAFVLLYVQIHLCGPACEAKQNVCAASRRCLEHRRIHRGEIHTPIPALIAVFCYILLMLWACVLDGSFRALSRCWASRA